MRPLNRCGLIRRSSLCCAIPVTAVVDSGVQRIISPCNENLGIHDNEIPANEGNFPGVIPMSLVEVQLRSICDMLHHHVSVHAFEGWKNERMDESNSVESVERDRYTTWSCPAHLFGNTKHNPNSLTFSWQAETTPEVLSSIRERRVTSSYDWALEQPAKNWILPESSYYLLASDEYQPRADDLLSERPTMLSIKFDRRNR